MRPLLDDERWVGGVSPCRHMEQHGKTKEERAWNAMELQNKSGRKQREVGYELRLG